MIGNLLAVLQPQEIAQRHRIRTPRGNARLLAEILPKRRAEWAERCLLMALRARAAKDASNKALANDFVILTHALAGDRPLLDIPLMVAIAETTVMIGSLSHW